MNIVVAGMGYVGLANALLLAKNNPVIGIDINEETVTKLQNREMPIQDKEGYIALQNVEISFSNSLNSHLKDANIVIVATPTSFDPSTNYFDMSSVDSVIKNVKAKRQDLPILIKSTVPIGYTKRKNEEYECDNILFSPEFLREGSAYKDVEKPSRVIIGTQNPQLGESIKNLYLEGSETTNGKEIPNIVTKPTEAESIKLFSNTYLALRVAFFNELDTYFIEKNLNAKEVIEGMGMDPRIGNFYNNPSFGYGGYCLPKDSKQALANFEGLDQSIIEAIVDSNTVRKNFIAKDILKKNPKVVGIYLLRMKEGSENFRDSAIFDIIEYLKYKKVKTIIFEPLIKDTTFNDILVEKDIEKFCNSVDIIVANRIDENLPKNAYKKVYTRSI